MNDVTVTEGNGGTVDATFTVGLDNASGRTVTVDFATANGTANAPADYAVTSGTLTFTAGQTTKQVTVQVNGDLLDEIDENFTLNLSGAGERDDLRRGRRRHDHRRRRRALALDRRRDRGRGRRRNDERHLHGHAGAGQRARGERPVRDRRRKRRLPRRLCLASGSLTFTAGQTTKQVTVLVNGDTLDESDESFTLNLSGAVNATISDGVGVGTITDDDSPPAISVDDVAVTEGDAGTTSATFTVGLSQPSGLAVSVDYATANGTAVAPADYAATSGTLNFAPGQTTKQVTVLVQGDLLDEANETFTAQPDERGQRDDRRQPGHRDDQRRRPAAGADDQRRERHRGRQRNDRSHLHRLALAAQRTLGDGRLRDRQQHGRRARRLHGHERHPHLHSRPDDEDR